MREILFRGKRKDNGDWAYGSLVVLKEQKSYYIVIMTSVLTEQYEVIPETVGQYCPHEEEKLFEHDIVNYVTGQPSRYVNCVVRFGEYETFVRIIDNDPDYNNDAGDVEKHVGFYLDDGSNKIPINSAWIKKIGNIHDNPELSPHL